MNISDMRGFEVFMGNIDYDLSKCGKICVKIMYVEIVV